MYVSSCRLSDRNQNDSDAFVFNTVQQIGLLPCHNDTQGLSSRIITLLLIHADIADYFEVRTLVDEFLGVAPQPLAALRAPSDASRRAAAALRGLAGLCHGAGGAGHDADRVASRQRILHDLRVHDVRP